MSKLDETLKDILEKNGVKRTALVDNSNEIKFYTDIDAIVVQAKAAILGLLLERRECKCNNMSVYDTRIARKLTKCNNCNFNQAIDLMTEKLK